jgi:hypothetical protein
MVADRVVLQASARITSVFAMVPIRRFVAKSFTTLSAAPVRQSDHGDRLRVVIATIVINIVAVYH